MFIIKPVFKVSNNKPCRFYFENKNWYFVVPWNSLNFLITLFYVTFSQNANLNSSDCDNPNRLDGMEWSKDNFLSRLFSSVLPLGMYILKIIIHNEIYLCNDWSSSKMKKVNKYWFHEGKFLQYVYYYGL